MDFYINCLSRLANIDYIDLMHFVITHNFTGYFYLGALTLMAPLMIPTAVFILPCGAIGLGAMLLTQPDTTIDICVGVDLPYVDGYFNPNCSYPYPIQIITEYNIKKGEMGPLCPHLASINGESIYLNTIPGQYPNSTIQIIKDSNIVNRIFKALFVNVANTYIQDQISPRVGIFLSFSFYL